MWRHPIVLAGLYFTDWISMRVQFTFSCPLFCILLSNIIEILDHNIQNNGQLKVNLLIAATWFYAINFLLKKYIFNYKCIYMWKKYISVSVCTKFLVFRKNTPVIQIKVREENEIETTDGEGRKRGRKRKRETEEDTRMYDRLKRGGNVDRNERQRKELEEFRSCKHIILFWIRTKKLILYSIYIMLSREEHTMSSITINIPFLINASDQNLRF